MKTVSEFPDPRKADAEGLVAVGGDFSRARLLDAYRKGIFPWTVNPITWWSPDPRGIIELDRLHISESLAKTLRRNKFTMTIDRAFRQVMEGCAAVAPGREETWISKEFIEGYTALHEAGHAHSVECWHKDELAGGIYGVSVGGFFAGESMFHRVSDASKVALVHLVGHLKERGFTLFDIQTITPTTKGLGAMEVSRNDYLRRLAVAVTMECSF